MTAVHALYHVVTRDSLGRIASRQLRAATPADALSQMARGGFTVLSCNVAEGSSQGITRSARLRSASPSRSGLDTASFSQDFAALIDAGLSVTEALQTLAIKETVGARRELIEQVSRAVSEGRNLSAAMQLTGAFPELLIATVEASERTGSMSEMLERIAQFYERRLQRSIDVATRVIEPALMIVIGTVIGAIVVLMYLPIFDLASSLS
jgi:general secretion pathway protein F